jgi:hypothetical protein
MATKSAVENNPGCSFVDMLDDDVIQDFIDYGDFSLQPCIFSWLVQCFRS